MASRENRSFLKRCLEKDLNIPNKRFKSGEETELFCENQSEKVVRGVGRGGRSWKSSYQRYRSRYYGSRKERNMHVKSKTANKEKEEDGIKDNIENADFVKIEDLVVWQPTLARRRSTKDSRSVISIKLKLLLKKMAMLLSSVWRR